MVSTEDAVIARLQSHGETFEILVDPELALDVRKGKNVDINELAVYQEVYEDVNKGKRASDEDINRAFGTNDFQQIAERIIKKGNVQITTEQRREMREDKRREIANMISRRAVDPKSDSPHPPQRILNAMEEVDVKIDAHKPASAQVEEVIEDLRPVLPLNIETVEIAVQIPAEYTGKAYGKVRDFASLKKEKWRDDGSWEGVVEMPAGMQGDFYNLLSSLTEGEAQTKKLEDK